MELAERTLDELEAPVLTAMEDRPDRIEEAALELQGLKADFKAIASQADKYGPDVVKEFKDRLENIERRVNQVRGVPLLYMPG